MNDAATITSPVNVAVMINWRSNVGTLVLAPDFMRLGDIPFAAGFDRQGRMTPADSVDDAVMSDDARADVAMHAIRAPKLFAIFRVNADDPVLDADDQFLHFLRSGDHDRRV